MRQPAQLIDASLLSIILPTYNRARFLPGAFNAIRLQPYHDWELIVVDDGSTDTTRGVVAREFEQTPQPTRYVYQPNQGPFGARNTGLDHASGDYVAFYDSDDLWLPHHLSDCVAALDSHPDVGWVYGACRIVNDNTGEVLCDNTFSRNGQQAPFTRLATRTSGALRILADGKLGECMAMSGLLNGPQNSVIRRSAISDLRFPPFRVGEDQLFSLMLFLDGCRFAYFDRVHTVYRVHGGNTSAAGSDNDLVRREASVRSLVNGFEELSSRPDVPRSLKRALHKRLGRELFWGLGYATLLEAGRTRDAMAAMARGLRYWPWSVRRWKTFLLSWRGRHIQVLAPGSAAARSRSLQEKHRNELLSGES